MKTLTEVIEDAERCLLPFPGDCLNCPHFDSTDDDLGYDCQKKILRDAVGYLKTYRDSKEWLELEKRNYAEAVRNCDEAEAKYTLMVLDFNRNDPLSWDELRQMEGKPVWIEEYDAVDSTRGWRHCRWMLIEFVNDSYMDARNSDGEQYNFDKGEETWKAYRKERE